MTHPAILGPAALILQLLLLLFVLLALLLLVPVDLEGRVARGGDRPEARVRVSWLFGRLQRDLFRGGGREPSMAGGEEAPPAEEEEGKEEEGEREEGEREEGEREDEGEGRGRSSPRIALGLLRTRGFLRSLRDLLRGLSGAVQVQSLRIDLSVGLSDPADTAEAFGLMMAVLMPLEAVAPLRAEVAPSFAEERLAGSFEGRLRVVPIKTLPPLARFLLSPPAWRAGWRAWRGKG